MTIGPLPRSPVLGEPRPIARTRGVALLAVLWLVVLAGLILVGVQKTARTHTALAYAELRGVQARWLARAGVERALAILEEDDPAVDDPGEHWFRDAERFENVRLGEGTYSVTAYDPASASGGGSGSGGGSTRPGLVDEASRVSLNAADAAQLAKLPEMTEALAGAAVDWRDEDDTPSPGGAERAAYAAARFPYLIRNAAFQTHRELMLVKGFEDGRFFGDPPPGEGTGTPPTLAPRGPAAFTTVYAYELNRTAGGEPRLNLNKASAEDLQNRLKFTSALAAAVVQARGNFRGVAQLLDTRPSASGTGGGGASGGAAGTGGAPPSGDAVAQVTVDWLAKHFDELTVSDDERLPARVNVNTAPREVLVSIPGLSDETADRILARRSSGAGAYRGVGELLESRALDEAAFRVAAERLTVRSSVFSVESTGTAAGVRRSVLAVIDRGRRPMIVLYWYETE